MIKTMRDRAIAYRLRVNTPNSEPDGRLCPEQHAVYKCSEPDNVYCPLCDTYYPLFTACLLPIGHRGIADD